MQWPDFDWKSVGNLVAGVAPTIAGALAGPFGPVASLAVTALIKAVGLGEDATPADLETALTSGKPELLLQLKQAEQDFQVKLKEADVDLERIYAGDRASARLRDVEFLKASRQNTRAQIMLICAGVSMVFMIAVLVVGPMLGLREDGLIVGAIITMLGNVSQWIAMAFNFEFGSTRGGQAKTDALVGLAATAKDT